MQQHNLVQGTPEWHAYRATKYNASDAPVMKGVSKYKSRTKLLTERKTGLTDDIGDVTQARFDDGHRFEALARPIAASIAGKPLYPVTGSNDIYGASFDGLTLNEDIAFEHKTLNNDLRSVFDDIETRAPEYRDNSGDLLPIEYRVQMEHQLLVSGANKCLFMASKWEKTDEVTKYFLTMSDGSTQYYNLIDEKHTWYLPDLELRQEITDGWAQFSIDLESYVPIQVIEKPKAHAVEDLPALFIQASGAILASNMEQYGTALATRLAEVRAIVLVTDQDFSNAKEGAKKLRENIVQAKLAKEAMLAQTATVGDAARMIDAWCEDMRLTALKLEQDGERADKAKKLIMINEAQGEFTKVIQSLEDKVRPIRLNISMPNFGEAIKGKSKYSSMQEAIDTLLANETAKAKRVQLDVSEKQEYMSIVAEEYAFLFADLQQIIFKADDDFKLLVNSRIKEHRAAELAKEAKIKADAEAALLAKQAAETVAPAVEIKPSILPQTMQAEFGNIFTPAIVPTQYFAGATPTVSEIVTALAIAFKVDELQAHKYLIDADFTKWVAEKKAA